MLGLAQEAHRDLVQETFQVGGLIAVGKLGHNEAGSNAVDIDVVLAQFTTQRMRQSDHAHFRGEAEAL